MIGWHEEKRADSVWSYLALRKGTQTKICIACRFFTEVD